MCDETVDVFLGALKFIRDWFVTSKMYEKVHDALFANDNYSFFYKTFEKVTFFT